MTRISFLSEFADEPCRHEGGHYFGRYSVPLGDPSNSEEYQFDIDPSDAGISPEDFTMLALSDFDRQHNTIGLVPSVALAAMMRLCTNHSNPRLELIHNTVRTFGEKAGLEIPAQESIVSDYNFARLGRTFPTRISIVRPAQTSELPAADSSMKIPDDKRNRPTAMPTVNVPVFYLPHADYSGIEQSHEGLAVSSAVVAHTYIGLLGNETVISGYDEGSGFSGQGVYWWGGRLG